MYTYTLHTGGVYMYCPDASYGYTMQVDFKQARHVCGAMAKVLRCTRDFSHQLLHNLT